LPLVFSPAARGRQTRISESSDESLEIGRHVYMLMGGGRTLAALVGDEASIATTNTPFGRKIQAA